MNNEQFRRLLQENENRDARSGTRSNGNETNEPRDGGAGGGATPGVALGSRMRSSIPMTPRSVTGVNFAHQLAEHRREGQQQPSTKRFKSSAAPKGTKLPKGYQDRASQRQTIPQENAGGAGADIEERVAALEELVKLGQIDQGTFDKLRAELGVGGDVKSTHMVKGLDWDLLRRVKAGEDVGKVPKKTPAEEEEDDGKGDAPEEEEVDLEAEFERVTEEKGQEAVAPVAPKEKKEKKGTMAPPPAPTQQKKSRNELLQELKASRAAAAAAQPPPPAPAEPVLGSRFKKLSESRPEKKRWVEHDENGRRREVLLVTDTQGNTKRKARWLDKPGEPSGLLVPDKGAKPLGMEVPAEIASKAAAPVEDDDGDIFEGVGADYNPLADIGDGDDDSSSESDEGEVAEPRAKKTAPTVPSAPPSKPRNYFATSGPDETAEADEGQTRTNPLTRDPALLAALKRAAALRQTSPSAETGGEGTGRGQQFLEEMRRREAQDAEDMDLGFGGSRVGDEEDEAPVVFEGEGRGGQKRKRGPKKKKGDKENVSDVMRVLDGRKKS